MEYGNLGAIAAILIGAVLVVVVLGHFMRRRANRMAEGTPSSTPRADHPGAPGPHAGAAPRTPAGLTPTEEEYLDSSHIFTGTRDPRDPRR